MPAYDDTINMAKKPVLYPNTETKLRLLWSACDFLVRLKSQICTLQRLFGGRAAQEVQMVRNGEHNSAL